MVSLRTYYEKHPATSCVRCIQSIVVFLNLLLAMLGLSMMASAGVLLAKLLNKEDPTVPSNGDQFKMVQNVPAIDLSDIPWFVFTSAGAGLFTFITAVTALCGEAHKSICCLNTNIVFMLLSLAGQTCLAVAMYMDKSWERQLPDDPIFDRVKESIKQNLAIAEAVALSVVGLQLCTLLSTCFLQSAYVSARDAAEDEEDELQWQRAPLMRRQSDLLVIPAPQPRSDEWSRRMKRVYNLDTSRFTYDPERASRPSSSSGVEPRQKSGRCSVM